jgi:outer membrane protein assembly factor BamB
VAIALFTTGLILAPQYASENVLARFLAMFWGPLLGMLLALAWWAFASRAPFWDRLLIPGVLALSAAGAFFAAHPTFRMGLIFFGAWAAVVAWPAWLLVTGALPWPLRRAGLCVVLALCFGACTLFRLDGVDGSMGTEVTWRFAPTAEDQYLAGRLARGSQGGTARPITAGREDWPGFRGPSRDGIAREARVHRANWSENPPALLWKQRIGPGWSSCVIVGPYLFTQEQQGSDEAVVCLEARTGKEVWSAAIGSRFDELVSGAGPRATPTFHNGKLYAFGANGALACLDAQSGKLVWKREVTEDTGASAPQWGFAASPCVAEGLVSVYAGAPDGKAVAAYDLATGSLKWTGGEGGHGYASVHYAEVAGQPMLLAASGSGLIGLDPKTGKTLLSHDWAMPNGLARCIQPTLISPDELLIGTAFGHGTRRLKVSPSSSGLTAAEVWTTRRINPYYNDQVLHEGHIYGFDGEILTCIDLKDGESKWRKRGFQNGQALLLKQQGLLVVQAEKSGEVALVEARPEECRVLGKFKALKGKTWNHPVVAHGMLFVRNGEEIACFDVSK